MRKWFWGLWLVAGRMVLGQLTVPVKYKFFPVGVKELPRHPVYLGFRDEFDMGGE